MSIRECPSCKPHEFQDRTYGAKRRVFVDVVTKGGSVTHRCTVCGAEGGTSVAAPKPAKAKPKK